MNYLITGGSGFIGTHLMNNILSNSQSAMICNIDLVESKIEDERLVSVVTDIRSNKFVQEKLPALKFDICIHLAALCKEPGFEWEEYFDTNHVGTLNVIDLCNRLGIEKIIFTSTMMVYKAAEIQRTEQSPTQPDTAYGISKLLAEKELVTWRNQKEGREVKIIRPAVVFGENEDANFTRLYSSLRRGFFPYVGKSSTIKSSIYVLELVRFVRFLIEKNPSAEYYNFSFPNTYSIKDIVESFKNVFSLRAVNFTLPFKLLLFAARILEVLNAVGLKNSIHHRRIQKLYFSTDIYPEQAISAGYEFKYDLSTSLEHWKTSDDQNLAV